MDNNLENAFLETFEKNQHRLFRICFSYAKTPDDTKDLFQEVLFHIWNSLPSFEGKSTMSTWMYRITINVCLRFRTKTATTQKRFIRMDTFDFDSEQKEAFYSEKNVKLVLLRSCIKELNVTDKAIISLYLEGLPYKEIMCVTGIKENTIAVRVKRIKAKLANCIKKQ